jgi:hypothetical protein
MALEPMATLYLEDWQKRMLKDFSKLKSPERLTRMVIKPGKGECLASYKIPPGGLHRDDWLIYLTNTQILQVKEQLGLRTAINNINITAKAMESGAITFS